MGPPIIKSDSALRDKEDPQNHWGSSFVYDKKQKGFYRRFGNKLRAAREQAGLSQEETARLAGLNRPYLSQIENGKRHVSLYLAHRLAVVLGCSLDALLETADGGPDV